MDTPISANRDSLGERQTHTTGERAVLRTSPFHQSRSSRSRQKVKQRRYLSSRMDSVFLSFSSHVSFSSAMIFSVSCRHKNTPVTGTVCQQRRPSGRTHPTSSLSAASSLLMVSVSASVSSLSSVRRSAATSPEDSGSEPAQETMGKSQGVSKTRTDQLILRVDV